MLLVKVKNAGELLWDSLDAQERMILAYAAAWCLFSLMLAAQRRARARLKAELVEELADSGRSD